MTCPKCGRELFSWMADPTDTPEEVAKACSSNTMWGDEECPYAACDDISCRALRVVPSGYPNDPDNERLIEELRKALDHWQSHRYAYGCSHGH